MAADGLTVLQRKAGADRPPPEFGVMTPAKALRLALAKAGEDVLSSNVLSGDAEQRKLSLNAISDEIAEGALAVMVEQIDGGRGLVILDAGAVAAVIEAMTTGQIVSGEPSNPPRNPTATDAFLAGDFLTKMLANLGQNLSGLPEAGWADGYTAAEQLKDIRSLPLQMKDVAYRSLFAPLEFNGGLRSGRLNIVLPWQATRIQSVPALPAPDSSDAPASPQSVARQRRASAAAATAVLMEGQVVLEAVLHRVRLPLKEVARWKPDDKLPFPVHAISSVMLVDATGQEIARGRLGQSKGNRALKLDMTDLPVGDLSPLSVGAGDESFDLENGDEAPNVDAIADLSMGENDPAALPEIDLDLPDVGDDDLPPLNIPMDISDDPGALPELPPIIE